jgi:hypothetical protein
MPLGMRMRWDGDGTDDCVDVHVHACAHTVGKKTVPMLGCFGKTDLA